MSYTGPVTQWGSQDSWSGFRSHLQEADASGRARCSSFADMNRIDAVMEEFRTNGFDSPYDPEEDAALYRYNKARNAGVAGMGPSSVFLRQKSWPAPEASPAVSMPARKQSASDATYSGALAYLTEEQLRVLQSLPDHVVLLLLYKLQAERGQHSLKGETGMECRFCKNNGEMESRYRSHRLRWQGRVACPVLRAYTCQRCGARGDYAHTLKYCPLTTHDERQKSGKMMQSIRQGSGRRRNWQAPSNVGSDYDDKKPTLTRDGAVDMYGTLDPMWEALLMKLSL